MDICIDFDGTVVTHEFPEIGDEIGAVPVLKRLVERGHNLILFTMRSNGQSHGDVLDEAVQWFKTRGIPLHGVQSNPNQDWSDSPKAYGSLYIDDSALGCPLVEPEGGRPYVDWKEVENRLEDRGLLQPTAMSEPAKNLQNAVTN